MVIFMGSYSGGGYDSSENGDSPDEGSTDDHTQTGVDDYTSDDGGDGSGQDSGSGTGVGPVASPGGSSGGGVITDLPEGDDPGDNDESEEREKADESQSESPEVGETEPKNDIGDPKELEEDENDEGEEDEVLVVVQEVDALSALSWSVQPVMKRIEECYGEEIELFYKPAPVREINTEEAKQKWVECSEELDMPVDPSFWDNHPPESTELVNKAFKAAIQQYRGMEYIRSMWRHSVTAGRDINDLETLVELASDLGLDSEQFEEDLDKVDLETRERGELPFTLMEIQGNVVPKNGRVRYSDFKTQFTFQGVEEQEPQELQGFVDEHGPVTTPEVMEVYEMQREEAVRRLEGLEDVSSFKEGDENFWY